MTDLIIISKSTFESFKNQFTPCIEINKKYQQIYTTYTCFTNPPVETFKFYTKIKKHVAIEPRKFANKDIYKNILGFLNVLNKSNYPKIINKISIIITIDNIQIIVNEILRICTIQIFYIELYIKLLSDVLERCCSVEKKIALSCIKKYATEFFANKEWIHVSNNQVATTAYGEFCIFQKYKTHILAKNMLLIQLHQVFDNQIISNSFFCNLLDDVEMLFKSHQDDNVTLILEMMLELSPFIIKTKIIPCNIQQKLQNIELLNVGAKKNYFIIQELKRLYDA